MAETKKNLTLDANDVGQIIILPDVINHIALIAALEQDDVATVGTDISRDLVKKHAVKNVNKSVRTEIREDDSLSVDLAVSLDFGSSIPTVVPQVQEKVKTTVENMTGLQVTDVNVRVIGVSTAEQAD
ncbi:MAG: Asp23/Gls24 family envelope stress response protein [Eubacterium sp.]|nr:Asp23/Gls24 family envelope stress response protein [Eubacterium sp.]